MKIWGQKKKQRLIIKGTVKVVVELQVMYSVANVEYIIPLCSIAS